MSFNFSFGILLIDFEEIGFVQRTIIKTAIEHYLTRVNKLKGAHIKYRLRDLDIKYLPIVLAFA